MEPIGIVRSVYPEKFGVPRQSGLTAIDATVELDPDRVGPQSLRGLEQCSHIWIVFLFHHADAAPGRTTVRPPRMGGNARVGVFATRSPFRPNPIGLSVVELARVNGLTLQVRGVDLVDRTPVLDIKPYLPYADAVAGARCEFAAARPRKRTVTLSEHALAGLAGTSQPEAVRSAIEQTLCWDPRPAYRGTGEDDRIYGMRIANANVRFRVEDARVEVLEVAVTAPGS